MPRPVVYLCGEIVISMIPTITWVPYAKQQRTYMVFRWKHMSVSHVMYAFAWTLVNSTQNWWCSAFSFTISLPRPYEVLHRLVRALLVTKPHKTELNDCQKKVSKLGLNIKQGTLGHWALMWRRMRENIYDFIILCLHSWSIYLSNSISVRSSVSSRSWTFESLYSFCTFRKKTFSLGLAQTVVDNKQGM